MNRLMLGAASVLALAACRDHPLHPSAAPPDAAVLAVGDGDASAAAGTGALVLQVGQTARLAAPRLEPGGTAANASGAAWRSSNERVATVDADGRVTAVREGDARITFGSPDGIIDHEVARVSVGSVIHWLGATPEWFVGGNWSLGRTPLVADHVVVAVAASQPQTGRLTAVHRLEVAPGAHLRLAGSTLAVGSDVVAGGTPGQGPDGHVGDGVLLMHGTGARLRGTVDGLRVVGSVSLDGATVATGAVSIENGTLGIADQSLVIRIP